MKKLTILIVEDDQAACRSFSRYSGELEDISIVSMTNNVTKALQDVQIFLPDAVILELELHKGSGNGFEFLTGLRKLVLDTSPYILITTHNSSNVTYEYARQLGADFIISKHQPDYSEKKVLDFLCMMRSTLQAKASSSALNSASTEAPQAHFKRAAMQISSELNKIGINPKSMGYKYLTDAILIVMDKPIPNLCGFIGHQYGKTEASVERAIQNAISSAWKHSDMEELSKHYQAKIRSEKGVPTVMEFIYYYANKIKIYN